MSFVGRGQQSLLGFDPGSVGGLILWLDAADRNTITMTGSNVSSWVDKSKNGYTMNTAPSGCSLPIVGSNLNGLSTVGINTYSTGIKQSTVIPTFTNAFWVRKERDGNLGFMTYFGADSTYDFHTGNELQFAHVAFSPQGVRDASLSMFRSTGVTRGTLSTTTMPSAGQINLVSISNVRGPARVQGLSYDRGPDRSATCDWGEVLLYSNALTPAQIQAVEGYLAWKWGISSYLPTTHTHRTSPPAVRPFSPLDMRGLTLWLDGADCNSMNLSGSNITLWRDKSGFNRNVSNSGTGAVFSSNGPVFGGGAAFLGSADYLHSATTGEWTIVAAWTATNVTANNPRILNYIGQWMYIEGQKFTIFNPQIFGSVVSPNVRYIVSIVNDLCGTTLFVNGSVDVSRGTPALNSGSGGGFTIGGFDGGGGDRFFGTIHELMTFSNTPTAAERQQVETYLATKWDRRGSLPSTHPARLYRSLALPFTPLQLPGLAFWLDATDSNSMTLSGSNVTQWRDKSSNAYAGTAVGNPVYTTVDGVPAVTFNGTSQYIDFGDVLDLEAAPLNIFAVSRFNAGGTGGIIAKSFIGIGQNRWALFREGSTLLTFALGADGQGVLSYADTNTSRRVLSWTWDRVTQTLYQNGINIASGGYASTTNINTAHKLLVGAYNNGAGGTPPESGYYLNGSINEIICVFATMTAGQRRQVEGHLAWKWGLLGALGGGDTHPYRYGPLTRTPFQSTPSGLAFWMDAADATTFTLSGSNVIQWRDKAVGYVGTAVSNPVRTTVDGLPAVTFNGSTQYVNFGNVADIETAPLNIFTVSKFNSTSDGAIFAKSAYGIAGRYSLLRVSGNLVPLIEGVGGNISQPGVADTNTTRRILSWTWDRTTNSLFQNGAPTPIVSSGFSDTTRLDTSFVFLIGAYNDGYTGQVPPASGLYFNGSVNEILGIFGTLTTTQRQQVEGYLAEKWNLRSSLLPARHGYLTGAPSGFTPASISSCLVWLDAADASSFTLSGSNVTQWNDKSGLGNHFTTLAGTSPTYSSNQVVFPSGGVMESARSIEVSFSTYAVIVFKLATTSFAYMLSFTNISPGGYTAHYSIRADNGILVGTQSAAGNEADFGNANYFVNGTFNPSFGTGTYSNSPVVVAAKNMSMTGTTTVRLSTAVGRPFIGSIYEVMLFSSPLTTSQRQQVEGYLAVKWGISGSLPAGHPSLPPSFLPTNVSGCSLWLDASDASTLTLSGSNVTAWRDKTGLTTLSLTGTSPTYVSNQVRFNSSGRFQGAYTMTTQTTMFAVYSTTNTTTNARLVTGDGINGYGNVHAPVGTDNDLFVYTGGGPGYYTTLTPQTGLRMYTIGFNGSNTAVWRNGSSATMAGTAANATATGSNIAIGASVNGDNPWIGELSELIFFNTALTTSNRQQVEGYLAWKWGLTTSLPIGHPSRPSFLPTDVSGCSLWLDAADATTLTLTGSNVTQWRDKSSNGFHATGFGSTTRQAFNSLQGINIGDSDYFSFSNATAFNTTSALTTFIVASATTPGNFARLLVFMGPSGGDAQTTSNVVAFQRSDGNQIGYERAALSRGSITYTAPFQFVGSAVFSPSNGIQYINGSSNASGGQTGAFGTSQYWIGRRPDGGFVWRGSVCEVLAYNFEMTLDQRQQVEGYLAAKWGLSSTFPVGHPYLSGPQISITPMSIQGCSLWLDAADSATLIMSGSNITQWRDKSGRGYHAVAVGTPTIQSLCNSTYQGVLCSGTSAFGYNNTTAMNPGQFLTTFAVAYLSGGGEYSRILGFATDATDDAVGRGGCVPFSRRGGEYKMMFERGSGVIAAAIPITQGVLFQGSSVYGPTSGIQYINGQSNASISHVDASFNYTRYGVGQNGRATGDRWPGVICEVITYDALLTTAQRQQVEGYLAWKWGIQTELPTFTHPYKLTRP